MGVSRSLGSQQASHGIRNKQPAQSFQNGLDTLQVLAYNKRALEKNEMHRPLCQHYFYLHEILIELHVERLLI